jgi:hypothetical protein
LGPLHLCDLRFVGKQIYSLSSHHTQRPILITNHNELNNLHTHKYTNQIKSHEAKPIFPGSPITCRTSRFANHMPNIQAFEVCESSADLLVLMGCDWELNRDRMENGGRRRAPGCWCWCCVGCLREAEGRRGKQNKHFDGGVSGCGDAMRTHSWRQTGRLYTEQGRNGTPSRYCDTIVRFHHSLLLTEVVHRSLPTCRICVSDN